MIFYIIAAVIVGGIYGISLLGWRDFKNVPEGDYKKTLRRFKRLELIEKGVICAFFLLAVFAVPWFGDNNGMVTLISVAAILSTEKLFGNWFRNNLLCPKCKGPIWIGNFYVLLRPLHKCGHCGHELYVKKNNEE